MSIWLPPTRKEFVELQSTADNFETPIVGILISPSSHGSGPISEVAKEYKDFTSLILDGQVIKATSVKSNKISGLTIYNRDPKTQEVMSRYPYATQLVFEDMIYYSDRQLVGSAE
jgi:hypothetical protein